MVPWIILIKNICSLVDLYFGKTKLALAVIDAFYALFYKHQITLFYRLFQENPTPFILSLSDFKFRGYPVEHKIINWFLREKGLQVGWSFFNLALR